MNGWRCWYVWDGGESGASGACWTPEACSCVAGGRGLGALGWEKPGNMNREVGGGRLGNDSGGSVGKVNSEGGGVVVGEGVTGMGAMVGLGFGVMVRRG